MNNTEWIAALKVGDQVVIRDRHSTQLHKVMRKTPTQVHVGSDKFRIKDGRHIGRDIWSWTILMQATPDLVAEILERDARNLLVNKITSAKWADISTDKLEQIAALLPQPAQKQ